MQRISLVSAVTAVFLIAVPDSRGEHQSSNFFIFCVFRARYHDVAMLFRHTPRGQRQHAGPAVQRRGSLLDGEFYCVLPVHDEYSRNQ